MWKGYADERTSKEIGRKNSTTRCHLSHAHFDGHYFVMVLLVQEGVSIMVIGFVLYVYVFMTHAVKMLV